ncbi:UTP--glucose-1-phosphate uridylyltransferase GalU [Domibacillus sp. DTU_2020_1001157_1_SI_ALB_TIR_016]|uniref:UTP--glucose-1-phosphate uridylyltransferase GalU n=1 Tax=Domibacillus sp. DTU_2020_1001157_1_SI_ALB_TIR_016 TaxID=3077789 RepID=UPI0028E25DD3|nr:UTP--glucose-1-phosphate uridylyltransferase GalU [Domibacillus sp. DTU_2020_1001157_1_SI_ALB_TIR_016]WNS81206.1 UTP--glucose-1-phosphate uridylyltransferase GalU [Domibacillus sp. DTU_2020_1001157_1_SI_ALB_TIR_016]
MSQVRKAIIPAAGLGTRFLPATKAMPKEMLPIVDKPTIQYIVEEAIASGIHEIIIVTGKGKRAIEDHFDHHFELEGHLLEKEKFALLEEIRNVSTMVDIHYIRQKEPKGLGHAVWCARNFIGDEPFAVLLGDDIVQSEVPCMKQMIDVYEKTQSSVLGVKKVPQEEVSRYGIAAVKSCGPRLHEVMELVEKPTAETAPSDLAIMGRYILTPSIFALLEGQESGVGGEIQLTDAIARLQQTEQVFAYEFNGSRYDVGEKMGFVQTTIEFALQKPELREPLLHYLSALVTAETKKNNTRSGLHKAVHL